MKPPKTVVLSMTGVFMGLSVIFRFFTISAFASLIFDVFFCSVLIEFIGFKFTSFLYFSACSVTLIQNLLMSPEIIFLANLPSSLPDFPVTSMDMVFVGIVFLVVTEVLILLVGNLIHGIFVKRNYYARFGGFKTT